MEKKKGQKLLKVCSWMITLCDSSLLAIAFTKHVTGVIELIILQYHCVSYTHTFLRDTCDMHNLSAVRKKMVGFTEDEWMAQ